MIIRVANPIYDSVFKYMMEDERIARTILSALLKKEVVEVQIRRNEYTNGVRDNISMFRIDFGARIREDDGSLRLILIEMQKTWLETETLRFRQYLGAQYANPENMVHEEMRPPYGIPMVAVYILGHRVGNIEVPVLYTNHKSYDYEGHEVTKGLPDPFVDSLTHDSIIVQIPLLHGQINNRLEKVLSVFDQTNKEKADQHIVQLDDAKYHDDPDMQYILHRLAMASGQGNRRSRHCHYEQRQNNKRERPTDFTEGPANFTEEPTDFTKEPADFTKEPADFTKEPADFTEGPADFATEPAIGSRA